MSHFVKIMFLFFWVQLAYAQGSSVIPQALNAFPVSTISQQVQPMERFNVLQLSDFKRSMTLEQAVLALTKAELKDSVGLWNSFDRKDIWFGFSVKNNLAQPIKRFIKINEIGLEAVSLFQWQPESSSWTVTKSGLSVPLNERAIRDSYPVFSVEIEPEERQFYVLKLSTEIRFMSIFVELGSEDPLLEDTAYHNLIHLLFFGALFSLLLYNLFIFLFLREKLYLYYILYLAGFLSFVFFFSGYGVYLFDDPMVTHLLYFCVVFSMSFLVLFVRHLLEIGKHFPVIDRYLHYLTLAFFVTSLLVLWDISFFAYFIFLSLPILTIVTGVGFYLYLKRLPLAYFFMFGTLWFLIGMFLLVGMYFSLLPETPVTRYAYLVGTFMEAIALALALVYRIRLLQAEKNEADERLNETLQTINLQLEVEVAKRTEELVLANAELESLSQRDGLTGLYNRRFFDRSLQEQWQSCREQKQPLSVIMIDIDFFKPFNDTYGHQAGDECIQAVSDVIQTVAKTNSMIASRYGGEEFCIICPNFENHQAYAIAQKIRGVVAEKRILHEQSAFQQVTISSGVACLAMSPTNPPEDLLKKADLALYQSKESGRNRVTIYQA